MSNCGECLMNDVEVVQLLANGKCPRCGADYSFTVSKAIEKAGLRKKSLNAAAGVQEPTEPAK